MPAVLEQMHARQRQQSALQQTALLRAAWQAVHSIALAEIDGGNEPQDLVSVFDAVGWDAPAVQANIALAVSVIKSRRNATAAISLLRLRALAPFIAEVQEQGTNDLFRQLRGEESAALETLRAAMSKAANTPDNITPLPAGYELTAEQERELAAYPIRARIKHLQSEVIPTAKQAVETAIDDLEQATNRNARVSAALRLATAERALGIVEAELAALNKM